MVEEAIRRIVRVRGRVQGVGFRYATARVAEDLGVHGSVRNLLDGSVEADVEGTSDQVERMVSWLREGPGSARVDGVTVREETPRGSSQFEIR